MVLAVDIGNTNIVIGCFGIRDEEIPFVERVATDHSATALQFAISIKMILELHNVPAADITGAIISSVVPSVTAAMAEAVKKITGQEAFVLGRNIETGLNIQIDMPSQLGADCIADAVAGLAEYAPPLLIIDMGTATTISVLNSQGAYLGGIIAPGLGISVEALSAHTAQLPKIALEAPRSSIGRNTVDSMRSGILYGTAGSIDGLLDRLADDLRRTGDTGTPTILATGGLSELIVPLCRHRIILDQMLLLKGLRHIFLRNMPQMPAQDPAGNT